MKRAVSLVNLLCVPIGAMIGSGWMLGPVYATKFAGPLATYCWLLGGCLVMIVALTFAELAAMLPVTGGIVRYPQFSHGSLVSFIMTWLAWCAYILLPPTEITALLHYAAYFVPDILNADYSLSNGARIFAFSILILLGIINAYGIKFVTKLNAYMVYFKLLVPILTALVFIYYGQNWHSHSSLFGSTLPAASQYGFVDVLRALPLAGVIFAFFGFRSSAEIGGEAKNPQITLPLSLLGSIGACMIIYTIVQYGFLQIVSPALWQQLEQVGFAAPFIVIVQAFGVIWLLQLLFINTIIAPFSSALMIVTTTARVNYAMAKARLAPQFMLKLNSEHVPMRAMWVNILAGSVLFLPFKGWQQLASFVIVALVISHAIAPITLCALRKQMPEQARPFRLPAAGLICRVAFIILNCIAYWAGWHIMSQMFIALLAGLIFIAIFIRLPTQRHALDTWSNAGWLSLYLVGLLIISYLGDVKFGGTGFLTFGLDLLVISIFSLVVFELALYARLPAHKTKQWMLNERELATVEDTAIPLV